jgi:hypothetical protein
MPIKFRLFFTITVAALALPANTVSAADLPAVVAVSLQVKPLVAARSPGSMLSLDVRCEGINGVGAQTPIAVTGVPEGTSIEIRPQSEQYALVSLVFPSTAAMGRYSLSVQVGSPAPLVEQKVEIEIGPRGELP